MIVVFLVGYMAIALEHRLKVDKAGPALIMGTLLWVIYAMFGADIVARYNPEEFIHYLETNPVTQSMTAIEQCVSFIVNVQIVEQLGEISETLFFLVGAMTIVELIDVHGGFAIITNRIKTRNKTKLLWLIAFITFFLSALLDNMTTSIVMVMLVRRIIQNYKERWVYASIIIIAANSGGAWSPIGDITTIMLWVKGNVSAEGIIPAIFLPSLVSMLVPLCISSRLLHGIITDNNSGHEASGSWLTIITRKERASIFLLGIGCLVAVPMFKSVTHLPPFMGVLMALGIMWVYTEVMYKRKVCVDEALKHRVPRVIRRVDIPTILFFLGILLAVSVLQMTGVLGAFASFLDEHVHNIYLINIFIGIMSSVVDNVPLVAAAIGMYPLADSSSVVAAADPEYMAAFMPDGIFWQMLAYCAGVGGSLLIIGSVAGVVVMGIEKISFVWYLKNVSLIALAGYLAGVGVFVLEHFLKGLLL
ncbi:MAG: sodium:proton antiporter NhaD [Rikenellaceae bacterium]|nr:sodium:proton antiporter NhaD [Rikenellaceae bacterium]